MSRGTMSAKHVTELERVGAHPALDFANTVSWRGQGREVEYLRSYGALLAWSRAAGLVSRGEAGRLGREAVRRPRRAAAALRRARTLRETIFRIASAVARGAVPPARAAARAHAARIEALAHAHLAPAGRGAWAPTWHAAPRDLDRPWWPVAVAFASLLERPGAYPLGICPDCSWLFLDQSRNRSRRWCSSGDCGNRARGRRFRARSAAR